MAYQIGIPEHVNAMYGLMDSSGVELQRVLREHAGLETHHGWLDFDTAYDIYSQTFGLVSGAAWFHWVGIRAAANNRIYVANSACGYMGVWSELTRDDWARLGGFSCLWVV